MGSTKIYAPNSELYEREYSKDHLLPQAPQCKEYTNVLLEPLRKSALTPGFTAFEGGICHENGDFIAGYVRNRNNLKANRSIFNSYAPGNAPITELKGEYIYGGVMMYTGFGHLIIDYTTRLWYIVKNPHNKAKIFFFSETNNVPAAIADTFWNMIDLLGIERERVFVVDKIFRAEKVYVPDQSHYVYEHYTDEIFTAFDRIREGALARCNTIKEYPKKIYFTRNQWIKKDTTNEDYFEEFFTKQGFKVIAPETYSFEEQICLAAHAEEVACMAGTPHLLTYFSRSVKKLIMLMRENEPFMYKGEASFCQAKNIDYYLIDVSMSLFPTVHSDGRFLIGPSIFWKQYLDDNNIEYTEDDIRMNWEKVSEYLQSYMGRYETASGFSYAQIKNCDYFDMLNRLNRVVNGTSLDRDDFNIKSKREYDKDIKMLNEAIVELRAANDRMTEYVLEQSAVHIPDALGAVDAPKRKAKLLSVNCNKKLLSNGKELATDALCSRITKKYNSVNGQWDYLLALPYVYLCESRYDLVFFAPRYRSIPLSKENIAKLNASAVDAVFDKVIGLDDSIENTVKAARGEEFYDLILAGIEKCCPQYSARAKIIFDGSEMYSIDTLIMKKRCFTECAKWLLPVLNEISANITSKEMPALRMVAQMLLTLYFSVNRAMYTVGVLINNDHNRSFIDMVQQTDTVLFANEIIQQQELDILCELRRICEKHGLTYYITAGTLLGAVRHKGFIPWDDDIDVAMPLKDIKRLAKICRTELNKDLFYQDHKSDKRYPFHFAKIRKNGTVVNDPFLANVNIHKGLYIDIFPLVKCPKKNKPAKIYFKLVEIITYAMIAKQDKKFRCGYTKKIVRAAFAMLKATPRPLLIALRGLICGAHELFCSGTRLCTVSGSHGYPREAYSADWFADTVELEFEGEEFPCPKGWHELLTSMYGDYMKLPDKKKRKGHFK